MLAPVIDRMLAAPARIESEIRQAALAWEPPAATIAFAGPAARRQVAPGSTVDILIVRADAVNERDPTWRTQVADLTHRVEEMAGNPVQRIETNRMGLRNAIHGDQPGSGSLAQGVRTIVGEDPRRFVTSVVDRERWTAESTL